MKDFNQDAHVCVLEHVLSLENLYYSKLKCSRKNLPKHILVQHMYNIDEYIPYLFYTLVWVGMTRYGVIIQCR